MTDDVLVYGRTQEEHDAALELVLDTLEKSGVTLNGDKCLLNQRELTFFWLNFSEHGISPTVDRCQDLREAPPPSNAKDLGSLLSLAQWNARFIENLSLVSVTG